MPFIAHMIGVDAYTMDDAGWQKVQAEHFANGALLDQIYGNR